MGTTITVPIVDLLGGGIWYCQVPLLHIDFLTVPTEETEHAVPVFRSWQDADNYRRVVRQGRWKMKPRFLPVNKMADMLARWARVADHIKFPTIMGEMEEPVVVPLAVCLEWAREQKG